MSTRGHRTIAGWACVGAAFLATTAIAADRVVLRDGFEVSGQVDLQENRIVVRSGQRVFYIGTRQLLKPDAATDMEPGVRLSLPQPAPLKTQPAPLPTRPLRTTAFDEFGRRTIVLQDARKREVPVIQGITEIYPGYAVLRGISMTWQSTIALAQIPSKQLLPMLRHAVDLNAAPDQLKLIDFLLQAGLFNEARAELKALKAKPNASGQLDEMAAKLDRRVSERALLLIHQALDIGQPARAQAIAKSLAEYSVPDDLKPKLTLITRELDGLDRNLAQLRQRVRALLTAVPESAKSKATVLADDKAFLEITEELSLANQARLQPLVALADQPGTTVENRLALTLSGWALGPDLAQKELPRAIKIWQQREALREAIETDDDVQFQSQVERLASLETPPELAMQMIPYLPAPRLPRKDLDGVQPEKETPERPAAKNAAKNAAVQKVAKKELPGEEAPADDDRVKPGEPAVVRARSTSKDFPDLKYHILLPPEYDRFREYPTVITLHGLFSTPAKQLEIWRQAAAENGAIVIAPEYRLDVAEPYKYSVAEHTVFLLLLQDARRRFAIDADRIFLSGHELGGMAAWDLGMSYPDQFAGLVPINGVPMFYCQHYWPNLEHLPVYCVEGELDGDNPVFTRAQFVRYHANGFNAIYVEYPGHGRESFTSELPTIFDWMNHQRRKTAPASFKAVSARQSDRRFYWAQIESFLPHATVAPELFTKAKFRAARLDGKVADNNSVTLTTGGMDSVAFLIPNKLVHLDAKELTIRVNRKVIHRGPLTPDLDTLLRELRRTGDRKNLIVKEIRVPRV